MDIDELIEIEAQQKAQEQAAEEWEYTTLLDWTKRAQQQDLTFFQFVDIVQRQHATWNLDLHVLFTGREGSGKSATAFTTACYCDPTFLFNVKKRLVLSEDEIVQIYEDLDNRLSELQKGINKHTLRFYQKDEAQNLLNRRRAMSKHNVDMVQLLMTMRVAKAALLYCTPNPLVLEREAVRRMNMIAVCNREELFIYINEITLNGKLYYGGAEWMIGRLHRYKQKSETMPKMTPELMEKIHAYPDLVITVPFFKDLYAIYDNFKIEKTLEFLRKLREKKLEAMKEQGIINIEEESEVLNFTVVDGGDRTYRDVVGNTIYKEDYYYVGAVASVLGWGKTKMSNALKRLNIPILRYKNKRYILGKHVVRLLQEA